MKPWISIRSRWNLLLMAVICILDLIEPIPVFKKCDNKTSGPWLLITRNTILLVQVEFLVCRAWEWEQCAKMTASFASFIERLNCTISCFNRLLVYFLTHEKDLQHHQFHFHPVEPVDIVGESDKNKKIFNWKVLLDEAAKSGVGCPSCLQNT